MMWLAAVGIPTLAVPAKPAKPANREPLLALTGRSTLTVDRKRSSVAAGQPTSNVSPLPTYCSQGGRRKPTLQPRASQRCRVKPTAGIYAPRYEAPPICRRGGTGQANGIFSVKHPSTTTCGVLFRTRIK
ncbi:hypothetical protein PGT21_036250 [Puccinia graminis f. sp. tritici]|uniref:Uncharacterized protein n=1 Tax=Puccinia graminis f. sp. tritici TaxID=56615 RepID=A0A5B0PH83_PUCGR|nr:hypothetical protein PGT21_036250 [Puccinia graminis f. sp. tritici]KAA1100366.1 hypothetical protein PGTUg99_023608 [Puccinia graminis f. sp. tritici]